MDLLTASDADGSINAIKIEIPKTRIIRSRTPFWRLTGDDIWDKRSGVYTKLLLVTQDVVVFSSRSWV